VPEIVVFGKKLARAFDSRTGRLRSDLAALLRSEPLLGLGEVFRR
jgi:hypothetical protein